MKPTANTATSLDPADCVSFQLRRAARAAARHYDRALKPSGLRNTQFTLLSLVAGREAITIGDLSREMGVDATTLTRNVDVLARRGLIEDAGSADGREHRIRLSSNGESTRQAALPLWRAAQASLLNAIGTDAWDPARAALAAVEDACS